MQLLPRMTMMAFYLESNSRAGQKTEFTDTKKGNKRVTI